MRNNALYFPYMKVPEDAWFTRVLLYWDKVGTIMPAAYLTLTERVGDYTIELVDAEVLTPVFPAEFQNEVRRTRKAFLELIDNHPKVRELRDVPFNERHNVKIHMQKIEAVSKQLCKRGLAREAGGAEWGWYHVEKNTADLFMAYLACVIGATPLQMSPITDDAAALAVFSSPPREVLGPENPVHRMRMDLIKEILPAPEVRVSAKELRNFKDKYQRQLSRFRFRLEDELISLADMNDPDLRSERLTNLKQRYRAEIDELQDLMKESGWHNVDAGTLCSIAIKAVAGEGPMAVLDLPGALSSAFSGRKSRTADLLREPIAYAILAKHRLGRQSSWLDRLRHW